MKPLECTGVAVGYEGKLVLSGIDLTLNSGEVMALLGPNGGGKSTLLRTLAGLQPKICGGVLIQGDDLDALSEREIARRVAFVPQEEPWHFAFTAQEVVAMGRLPQSNGYFESQEDLNVSTEAMKEAGCDELRDRPVTELSGGEKQRVLIARAIAQATPLVFLDEPTSHLDPEYQTATIHMLKRLAKKGKSLLVAVHDLVIVGMLADLAVVVADGQASSPAAVDEVLTSKALEDAYRTEFDRIRTPEGRLLVVPRARP